MVGSFEFLLISRSLTCIALYAISLRERLTRIELLSRKYLLISPIIIGTAYVENCTFWLKSKLSIAFISPIQPTWNKSSTFSPLLLNLCITLSTSLKLPFTKVSRACKSPFLIFINNLFFSSLERTGSFDVFTPQISTLFVISFSSLIENRFIAVMYKIWR